MKASAIRIGPVLLLSGAALAVLAFLLWPGGGGQEEARAYPGLTVGIDVDPVNTTNDADGNGLYETVNLSKFERCITVAVGGEIPIDVFVLDVLDLNSFVADIEYDGSVVNIIGSYTGTTPSNPPKMFMSAQTGSDVQNYSQNDPSPSTGVLLTPDTDGNYQAAAADISLLPPNGDDGSGPLVRLKVKAMANGVSPFNINMADIDGDTIQDFGVSLIDVRGVPDGVLGDANGDGFFDGPFINPETTIAVGTSANDSDGDGWPNGCDNCPNTPNFDQADFDGDGIGDACDPDDDNDGRFDWQDNCPLTYNPGQEDWNNNGKGDACEDSDGDGVMDDVDNCRQNANADQADMDGDGVGDVCDPDKDGDGHLNSSDNCPSAYNPGQENNIHPSTPAGDHCDDPDADGVADLYDNCPDSPNPSQADDDGDGVGNPCDNCRYTPNPDQKNNDGDAMGDACDPDDDNDTIPDTSDNCQFIANGPSQAGIPGVGNQTDTDGDGLGDPCDPDADSDGYPKDNSGYGEVPYGSKDWVYASVPEVCDGLDNDGDTLTDEGPGNPPTPFADIDADTVPDCVDSTVDTDGDTVVNTSDLDDDGDTINDSAEHVIATDSLVRCNNGTGLRDWPVDFNDDRIVDIEDIAKLLPPVFGSVGDPNGNGLFEDADPQYTRRKDLNGDRIIDIEDIAKLLPPTFGSSCTP